MSSVEIEAKLEAPTEGALLQLPIHLAAVGMTAAESELSIALDHYLDTEDMAFRAAGWALRLRDAGTRKLLTLKAMRPSEGGLAVREELEEQVEWDGSWHFPDSALGGKVAEIAGDDVLTRLFGLRQDRTQFHAFNDDGLWVEISLDKVRWEAGDSAVAAFVVELELREGDREALSALLSKLAEQTGWPTADWTKFDYGLTVAGLA